MYTVVRRLVSSRGYNCQRPLTEARMKMSNLSMTSGERYDTLSNLQKHHGLTMIDKLDIKKGSTILDLGCGSGYLANVLSGKVGPEGRVIAVDPNAGRIKVAREKYSTHNVEYSQADDRTFPQREYDLVVCNTAIHYVSDKETLHKRVYSNLVPGGQFAFSTSDGPPSFPEIGKRLYDELVGEEFLHQQHTQVKQYLTAGQYKTMAIATGFEFTDLSREDVHMKWRNLDHFIETMQGWYGDEYSAARFDQAAFRKLKEKYGDSRPVEYPKPTKEIYVILTKPM